MKASEHGYLVVGESGMTSRARHVILALGYRDLYRDVPGFVACWGRTIVPCPYCDGYENRDRRRGIDVHRGRITAVEHVDGEVRAARLDSGERIGVDTLWWRPDGEPQPLTRKIIRDFDFELEESGSVKTDAQFRTSARGLWAVGDVLG